jgi:general secretion pathway protein L
MIENRLLFHDRALQRFDWCSIDPDNPINTRSGSGDVEQLGSVFAAGTTVTVFVPQELILMSAVAMPPRASKQQLNAVGFAVEEQLAEDIEDCFFATLAQQADHNVPVAVVSIALMDRIVALLAGAQLNSRYILPALYLCPWEEGALGLARWNGGFLLRNGQHQGLYCQAELLTDLLAIMQRSEEDDYSRIVALGELPDNLETEQWQVTQISDEPLLTVNIESAQCLNLKQKQYQGTHQVLTLLRPWKWPALALVAMLLVWIASAFLDSLQLQRELDHLVAQQQTLLREHLPAIDPGRQPRAQLAKHLAEQQEGGQGAGFLDQLHEYVRLKTGFAAIKTGKIQYQKGSLVINIESPDLKSLEGFRAKIEQAEVVAEIENVNISPEKTTARLVMRGGS